VRDRIFAILETVLHYAMYNALITVSRFISEASTVHWRQQSAH